MIIVLTISSLINGVFNDKCIDLKYPKFVDFYPEDGTYEDYYTSIQVMDITSNEDADQNYILYAGNYKKDSTPSSAKEEHKPIIALR